MVELEENIMINASFFPNDVLVEMIFSLEKNQAILNGEEVIAFYTNDTQEEIDFDVYELIEYDGEVLRIENTWDIFRKMMLQFEKILNFLLKIESLNRYQNQ